MMPVLYDPAVVDRILTVALRNATTQYTVYHSPLCAAPAAMAGIANIETASHHRVPPGRLVVDVVGDRWLRAVPNLQENLMRVVRSITFLDEGMVIEYEDTELSRNGARLHTALEVPRDDAHADDIDELRAHAGLIVADELSTWLADDQTD